MDLPKHTAACLSHLEKEQN